MFVSANLSTGEVLGSVMCWVNHLECAYFSTLAIAQDNTYSATDIKVGCYLFDVLDLMHSCVHLWCGRASANLSHCSLQGWGELLVKHSFNAEALHIFKRAIHPIAHCQYFCRRDLKSSLDLISVWWGGPLSLSLCNSFPESCPARTVTLRTLLPGFLQPANLSLFWSRN